MLQTWFAIALKEFRHFLRDRMWIQTAIIVQVVQIALIGFIDVHAKDLPTVIVDQDESSASRELVQKLQATHVLKLVYLTTSVDVARAHITAGRARVAVVIPHDYDRLRASHQPANILALVDGSDSVVSGQAVAAIHGVTAQVTTDTIEASDNPEPVSAHTLMLFNPEGKTANFTLPGLLAILLMGEWVYFAGAAIAKERENETLDRLMLAKLHPTGYLLGKVTPYAFGAFVNASVLLFFMTIVFQVPINGSFLLVVLAMALYSLTLASLGAYFGADADMEMEVAARTNDLHFPVLFLCGYIFPLSSLPKWLMPISFLLPPTHMIEVMRGLMLRGIGTSDLWVSFLYLSCAPIVLWLLSVRKIKAVILA